jgi:regulator of replication initiation timing
MNRTILIVICDFLLVSLLAFSTVDINKVAQEGVPQQGRTEPATNQIADASNKDLAAVMRLALDEERKNRDQLLGELVRSRESVGEREKQTQTLQQQLQSKEQENTQLQRTQTELQRKQSEIQQQFAAAQTNLQALGQKLESSSSEALLSKEKLAAMEAEIKKKAEESSNLKQQLDQLSKSNQFVLGERQRLAGQLQVAEVEKRHATEQAAKMEQEVKYEREEKAKLADGVKALASKSGELAEEVRVNRPLAPNTIFNEFITNRVAARFNASRSGLLGIESNKSRDTETILVSDGTNTFAICHVQDTPLTLWDPGTEWETLTGTLAHNTAQLPIRSLAFSLQDPRLILIPVTKAEAAQLGARIYRASADPYKFQDAVLVGAREGYYGECRFQIDLTTPEYVKLDNSFLKGLFGKFNPSRGDLVFSKTGELLGIMANGTYCLMIRNFYTAAAFQFSPDVRQQHTGATLSLLYSRVLGLPFKVQ